MNVFRITRSLSVVIPRCRPLFQPDKIAKLARTLFGFQHNAALPQIIPSATFCDTASSQLQTQEQETVYLRLEGVPFSAGAEEIQNFLDGVDVSNIRFEQDHIYLVYVQIPKYSVETAMSKSGNYIGSRYINVQEVSEREEQSLERQAKLEAEMGDRTYMKLRGLPFSASVEDIKFFLEGIDVDNIIFDRVGSRFMGKVFVRVPKDSIHQVLALHKKYMGDRFIEVMHCSFFEMSRLYRNQLGGSEVVNVPDGKTFVTLKGIPFRAGLQDIKKFIGVPASEVLLGIGADRRPSGMAYCLIDKEDLSETLEKNNKYMTNRYIEVYETSPSEKEIHFKYADKLM